MHLLTRIVLCAVLVVAAGAACRHASGPTRQRPSITLHQVGDNDRCPDKGGVDQIGDCVVRLVEPRCGGSLTKLYDVRPDLPGIQARVTFNASPGCIGREVQIGVKGGEYVRYPEIKRAGNQVVPDLTLVATDEEPGHPIDVYITLGRPPQSI